jgi:hypothetical protein
MPWRDRRQQLRGEPYCECEREENRLDEGAGEGEVDREDGDEEHCSRHAEELYAAIDFDGGVIDRVVSVPLALLR